MIFSHPVCRLTVPQRSRHTPLNTVKAVILGQDPYHNINQAHGLCFSVRPPTSAPPSLKNMYKALKKDYPTFSPPPNNGGLLTPWADRGVLLLNTCLTVRAHEANSHAKQGWENFTQKVIDTVAKVRTRGVVFLAWGTPAQTRVSRVSNPFLLSSAQFVQFMSSSPQIHSEHTLLSRAENGADYGFESRSKRSIGTSITC